MKRYCFFMLIVSFFANIAIAANTKYELATEISFSDDILELHAQGYTKLNLLKFELTKVGNISLTGSLSVDGGKANIVMWSKVQGKYYFTKLPALQEFSSRSFQRISIPFSSPENPVTEVLLDFELPAGGTVRLKDIELE